LQVVGIGIGQKSRIGTGTQVKLWKKLNKKEQYTSSPCVRAAFQSITRTRRKACPCNINL
jgi:hypothetical protein